MLIYFHVEVCVSQTQKYLVIFDVVNVFIQMTCSVSRVTLKKSYSRLKQNWPWENVPVNFLYCGWLLWRYIPAKIRLSLSMLCLHSMFCCPRFDITVSQCDIEIAALKFHNATLKFDNTSLIFHATFQLRIFNFTTCSLSFYARFNMLGCQFRHVLKPKQRNETTETKTRKRAKRNHHNKRNETTKTSEIKREKQAKQQINEKKVISRWAYKDGWAQARRGRKYREKDV